MALTALAHSDSSRRLLLTHTTCDCVLQVKQSSKDSRAGGDWAVRIKAGLSAAGKQAHEQEQAAAAESGSKPRQRRLSLLLYFADAHWHTGEVEMWPDSQPSKVGQVGCTFKA
jgi:hypothetical protein